MPDTEKITINMNPVDMGQIDLLVEEGFFTNRTDFIRSAIRSQLNIHSEVLKQVMIRKSMAIGVIGYTRQNLETLRAAGQKLAIRVVGVFYLPEDVSPELVRDTIESLEVHGVIRAGEAVKKALADRIR